MLMNPKRDRYNQCLAVGLAVMTMVPFAMLGVFLWPGWWVIGLVSAMGVLFWTRRGCSRRMRVMAQPFPRVWEAILRSRVVYFNALDDEQKERFRQLVKVFLDETRITGIRTDVDETTRVLVAASAIIPIFNFDYWEYAHLGEVLIYPGSFDQGYQTDGSGDRDTLGMVGAGGLSGVMILSKPALLTGFDIANDKRNVGIHEFAHLVDKADGHFDGLPPGVPADLARQWIEWVMKELANRPGKKRSHINPYGYTNEVEYFAVMVEYFFEAPEVLQRKNPELYDMLKKMMHQDTVSFLPGVTRLRRRIGRNSPCPCGSGKKYKKCCLRLATQGVPREVV